MQKFKSGYVTIIGKPNVGKSTLINAVVGKKVSIVSGSAGTTRFSICGIKNFSSAQIIFFDTPGIYKPKNELEQFMYNHSYNSIVDADIILFLINAKDGLLKSDLDILNKLTQIVGKNKFELRDENNKFKEMYNRTSIFLVINKIDLLNNKDDILKIVEVSRKHFNFDETIYISAKEKTNLDSLEKTIIEYLPERKKIFDSEEYFKLPLRLQIGEIIREKLFKEIYEEIPQSTCVIVENIKSGDINKNMLVIEALIIVEKERHKSIIIGEDGKKLKSIGSLARCELEVMLKKPIFLSLKVKLKEHWRDRRDFITQLGY